MMLFSLASFATCVVLSQSQFVPEQYDNSLSEFQNAATITCGQRVNGTTVGGPNHGANGAPDAFLKFRIAPGQSVQLDACLSRFDTHLRILNAAGTEVYECDDCGSCGTRSVLVVHPHPTLGSNYGQGDLTVNGRFNTGVGVDSFPVGAVDYWLVIEGYGNNAGPYSVFMDCTITPAPTAEPTGTNAPTQIPTMVPSFSPTFTMYPTPAPTDHFENIPIIGAIECGNIMENSSTNMGHYGGHQFVGGGNTRDAPDAFYTFTGSDGATMTFSSCGSSFDTFMRVLQESAPGSGEWDQVMACDDCNHRLCPAGLFRTIIQVSFDASLTEPNYALGDADSQGYGVGALTVPVGTYVIQLEGFGGQNGDYILNLTCDTQSPTIAPSRNPTTMPTPSPTPMPTPSPTPNPTTLSPTINFNDAASTGGSGEKDDNLVLIVGIVVGFIVLLVLIGAVAFIKMNANKVPPPMQSSAFDNPGYSQHDEGRAMDNPLYDEQQINNDSSGYMDVNPGEIRFAPEDDV